MLSLSRVGSVKAHGWHQPAGGGSIPAPTLHYWIDTAENEAQELVERFHYSRRWPSNVQLVMTAHDEGGLFGNRGSAVAAVVYAIPGARWSVPVWELSRLVRRDDASVSLSALIAASVRTIRKRNGACLLVSFADVQQGHHGGVYQASGWHYDGMRASRMEGLLIDGAFITGRNANHKYGTQSPSLLAERGITAEPKRDEGKHLYWKAVTDEGLKAAALVGLQKKRYPKPNAEREC